MDAVIVLGQQREIPCHWLYDCAGKFTKSETLITLVFCSLFSRFCVSLIKIVMMQTLDIWNMVNNQSITVRAHEGLVATLAQSPVNGIVASASYDYSVKLWK
ncbi:hypothetical protein PR202_ga23454 [Eleusine coracana subsp. coracana]|uniref:Uncharacterized protein n=1 Tax=Eleusine coracana subsp. coracana TaxID=191504 RepID=A0AAV5D691_ELECO|nr:hypothetical protein PR202_ga23454 [Eleusine coracana subsp. coracana]